MLQKAKPGALNPEEVLITMRFKCPACGCIEFKIRHYYISFDETDYLTCFLSPGCFSWVAYEEKIHFELICAGCEIKWESADDLDELRNKGKRIGILT